MGPALVLAPESDLVWHAHFESVSLESVTLHLLEEVSHSFETSSLFVSFSHSDKFYAFIARVLEYQNNPPQPSSYLILQLPSQIIGMERRMSYRVAIGEKVVPLVRLSTGESRILLPKPKDLSLTGILVEFDEVEDPDLLPQAELWLELILDDDAVLLKSVIKRREGHRYSLFFPEVLTKHGVYAPPPLRKIVKSLESNLLQERVHPDKPELSLTG